MIKFFYFTRFKFNKTQLNRLGQVVLILKHFTHSPDVLVDLGGFLRGYFFCGLVQRRRFICVGWWLGGEDSFHFIHESWRREASRLCASDGSFHFIQ